MDFHHPLFESLALPLVLSFAATGLLRAGLGAVHGRRWAATGVAPAILVASAWVIGWQQWPGSLTEELPWIYAAAALLGVGLEGMRALRRTTWLASCVLWALVLVGLSDQPLALQAVTWMVGALAIAAVLSAPPERADAPASLVVAGIGLAAVAFLSGSALLFELGLSIAAAIAGCALWLWPVARIGFGACGAVVSVIAWLAMAQGVALLTPVHSGVLLLLAGALLSGPMLRWLPGSLRPAMHALIVAALAALWVAAAVMLAFHQGSQAPGGKQDDLYYTPRW
ncbi:hypothetical protein [Variovorax saccharolyticus]|uniref:hypothetical protein n=1 Tax=Variovorax saccharolyticus TaxID=3053516 RepID=UPI002577ACAE|nr:MULTISPECIES: hypothetical protein [unclassified Variovorax]MDM0016143.1 hypothetical protein [Variovorax sp. J22R187]MDM0027068.1 hypothetical protein [Variovorax sp. J31P216]